jgi:hypothetical protein
VKAQDIIETSLTMSRDNAPAGVKAETIVNNLLANGFQIKKIAEWKSDGKYSQNNHINGHASQIANEYNDSQDANYSLRDIRSLACRMAVEYGYPTIGKEPMIEPKAYGPETTKEEATLIIDQLHIMASFLDMQLIEQEAWR